MTQPILYETHSHTPLCRHAVGQPEDYAAIAQQRGLRGLIVTCHNPMPDGFARRVRMSVSEFDQYTEMVARAAEAWEGRIDVRLGLEADYFPGYEAWLEEQLMSADFDYVLGSVHPQLAEYRERFWSRDPLTVQRTYFNHLADAAETKLFDCLAHPDLIKNETSADWCPETILEAIRDCLDRIAKTGMAMELNTSGLNKVVPEMNPCPEMLEEMAVRSIPVVIGSDAHAPDRVADRFEQALDLLERSGYQRISYFLGRERHELPIEQARRSLRALMLHESR